MNAEMLTFLGITKEDLLSRIVDNAVAEIVEYERNRGERDIHAEVKRQLNASMVQAIEAAVHEQATKAFDTLFQPINSWGEATGEPVTVRQMIFNHATTWWTAKVNSKGEYMGSNGYGSGIPRAEYIAKGAIEELLKTKLAEDLARMQSALREQVKAAVTQAVAQITVKLMG